MIFERMKILAILCLLDKKERKMNSHNNTVIFPYGTGRQTQKNTDNKIKKVSIQSVEVGGRNFMVNK